VPSGNDDGVAFGVRLIESAKVWRPKPPTILRLEKWTTMCRYQNTKSTTTPPHSRTPAQRRVVSGASAKSSLPMTPGVSAANASLNDWKQQPVRAWELIEVEDHGISVLELRERFLRILAAWMRRPANDWIN
jgi:hypothetical protein